MKISEEVLVKTKKWKIDRKDHERKYLGKRRITRKIRGRIWVGHLQYTKDKRFVENARKRQIIGGGVWQVDKDTWICRNLELTLKEHIQKPKIMGRRSGKKPRNGEKRHLLLDLIKKVLQPRSKGTYKQQTWFLKYLLGLEDLIGVQKVDKCKLVILKWICRNFELTLEEQVKNRKEWTDGMVKSLLDLI